MIREELGFQNYEEDDFSPASHLKDEIINDSKENKDPQEEWTHKQEQSTVSKLLREMKEVNPQGKSKRPTLSICSSSPPLRMQDCPKVLIPQIRELVSKLSE